ncbi:hypothetical protein MTR67_030966 [Solanum verrucosum]|uniref:Reverse transcriptase zinc-binding domain-containing protein n=1 Tax=Solanum verrucosum TaxID=315347 RepID=A0AAF0U1L3_SOLVR|nr:hypothetical protein MTR67_030966 [Solanum verrucosum]
MPIDSARNVQLEEVKQCFLNGEWNYDLLQLSFGEDFSRHVSQLLRNSEDEEQWDKPWWMLNATGKFTIGSAWEFLRDKDEACLNCKHSWITGIPFKVSFLTWRIWQHRLPIGEVLVRNKMCDGVECECCADGAQETIEHLFIRCSNTNSIWTYFAATKRQSRWSWNQLSEEIDRSKFNPMIGLGNHERRDETLNDDFKTAKAREKRLANEARILEIQAKNVALGKKVKHPAATKEVKGREASYYRVTCKPRKCLYTTMRELVENALDSAGIVEITVSEEIGRSKFNSMIGLADHERRDKALYDDFATTKARERPMKCDDKFERLVWGSFGFLIRHVTSRP